MNIGRTLRGAFRTRRRPGFLSVRKRIFFVFVILAVAFAAGEIAARRIVKIDTSGALQYAENPDLLFEFKPARAPDRVCAAPKPAGVFRISSVGDSVASNSDGKTYMQFLLEFLREDHPGRQFEVVDHALNGYNSREEETLVREKALKCAPDWIVVGYCDNDNIPSQGLTGLPRAGHPKELGGRLHSRLAVYLEQRYFDHWAATTAINDYSTVGHFFRYLKQVENERATPVLVVVLPLITKIRFPRELDVTQRVPIELAEAAGVQVVRPSEIVGDANPLDLALHPNNPGDFVHLNERGHLLVAQQLRKRAAQYIKN